LKLKKNNIFSMLQTHLANQQQLLEWIQTFKLRVIFKKNLLKISKSFHPSLSSKTLVQMWLLSYLTRLSQMAKRRCSTTLLIQVRLQLKYNKLKCTKTISKQIRRTQSCVRDLRSTAVKWRIISSRINQILCISQRKCKKVTQK